jgi:endonuclease YncB( thermonuclease family)
MEKYFAILFIFLSINVDFSQTMHTAIVIEIKDGDTVVVLDYLNNQTTLRLVEVDCPEKNQPFGTKAKQFTSKKFIKKQ